MTSLDPTDPGYACQQFNNGAVTWTGHVSRDYMHKVLSGIDPTAMQLSASAWHDWQAALSDVVGTLHQARADLASAWDSEAAEQAIGRLGAARQSADNLAAACGQIGDSFRQFGDAVARAQHTKGATGEGWTDNVYNAFGGGDNDRAAAQTRDQFRDDVNAAMATLPTTLITQLRGGGNTPISTDYRDAGIPGLGGPGSSPSGGAGGAPGGFNPGGLPAPGADPAGSGPSSVGPDPSAPTFDPARNAPGSSPGGLAPGNSPGGLAPGGTRPILDPDGSSPVPGYTPAAGAPLPGGVRLDAGSSLAGFDTSASLGGVTGAGIRGGFAGASGGGFGAGGFASSGGSAFGSGAGLSGAPGGMGIGASGAGSSASGLSAADAAAIPRPTAAAGQSGMMGMGAGMGGAGRGGENERERLSWLVEDEDVWGGSSAPPGVIG